MKFVTSSLTSEDLPLPIGPIKAIAEGRGKPPPVTLSRIGIPVGWRASTLWSSADLFKDARTLKRHARALLRKAACNQNQSLQVTLDRSITRPCKSEDFGLIRLSFY